MSLRRAGQIADAVLYEGYVLYPYRASAAKNRFRWQVGLVTPREYSEAVASDPWHVQTECLAEIDSGARLGVAVRCLQVQERLVEQPRDPEGTAWRAVDSVVVDGRQLVTWEEAVAAEFVQEGLPLDGAPREWSWNWTLDAAAGVEPVRDRSGRPAARIVRRRAPVVACVRVAAEPCGPFVRIRVRVENLSPCRARTLADRNAALHQSLAGTHSVLAIEHGAFVSLLDPPPEAAAWTGSCRNEHTWPVLAGPEGSRATMLSAPIILYDYPAVAPESPGDLFDATEIDEMLMWRLRTLTDEEKREARATDERAARILDRAEAASAPDMGRLHGAIRRLADAPAADRPAPWEAFLNPPEDAPPEAGSLAIGSAGIGSGSRVQLRPTHRSDTLDMCLHGRLATVTGVYRTLEGKPYVAVRLDDDPFGAGGALYRRALFFHPDEVVPLDAGAPRAAVEGPPPSAVHRPGREDVSGRTLVAGIGNVFLGDDGFGVEVAARLAREPLRQGVRVVDTGIRARHLAYELVEGRYETAIFVDAVSRGGAPGTVYLIEPEPAGGAADGAIEALDGHAMHPDAVLALVRTLGGVSTRFLVVGCEPECVEERMGLSPPVARGVDDALALLRDLLGAAPSVANEVEQSDA